MTTVQPLGKNILIQPLVAEEKTNSGIFLPDTASQEKPQQGKVVAVGSDDDIAVQAGQQVIYSRYAGTEVSVDGEDYLIVKSEEVLAIIS